MNLLFLCNSSHDGGAEIWVRRVALALRERGHGVVVAAPAEGLLAETFLNAEIPFIALDAGPVLNKRDALAFLRGWRRNRRRMLQAVETARRDHDVEVVHLGLTAEKLLIGASSPLPVVWTEHGPLPSLFVRSPLFRLYRRAALAARAVHCVSEATASHFRGLGFPSDRLRTIRAGLRSTAGSSARAREIRAELGIDDDHIVAGAISRLVWVKGVDAFLTAAAHIAHTIPALQFLVIGDGRLRPELEAQAERLGLNGRVTFMGYRPDVPDLLRVIDIHVAPSVTEGFSMSVLEAMHAGVPSVATAVGGHLELVLDGRTGFLVNAGDTDALAERVVRLAVDPRLRARLGTAALDRARQEFDESTFLRRLEALFVQATVTPTFSAAGR